MPVTKGHKGQGMLSVLIDPTFVQNEHLELGDPPQMGFQFKQETGRTPQQNLWARKKGTTWAHAISCCCCCSFSMFSIFSVQNLHFDMPGMASP